MRFFYLRDENGHPIGCLASELDKTTDTIKYAVSVCNPVDRFNKKQAQALAAGRIAVGEYDSITLTINKGKTKQRMLKNILWNVTKFGKDFPNRAREAAKRWLDSREEKQ